MAGTNAAISVSVASRFHGRGYGPKVIGLGVREVFKSHPVEQIDALIRTDNKRSHSAFVRAGFIEKQTRVVRGEQAHHLVLYRSMIGREFLS